MKAFVSKDWIPAGVYPCEGRDRNDDLQSTALEYRLKLTEHAL
jgi:hypothetical protein